MPGARDSFLVPSAFESVRAKIRSGLLTRVNCPAYDQLIADAESSLTAGPFSVTQKKHVPPSGDKRDYFSLSVYFWPNQETADGLPYVPRDGLINPEVNDYDRPTYMAMYEAVDALSLAYGLGGDERFAQKAVELLHAWFVDERTRMNPNMLFAQYIPGDNIELPWKEYPARFVPGANGRKGIYVSFGGVIEDLHFLLLTDCIKLLRQSPHWNEADDKAIVAWYADYTEWLLTHQHGLDEAACLNNHGSWYWADILGFLNFIGEKDRSRDFAEKIVPARLRIQVEPDGSVPDELCRAISKRYTSFTICSFTNIALSSRQAGYDAWSLRTEDGRSIPGAVDWFLPYLTGGKEWTWRQIKPFDDESMIGPLAAAAVESGDPKYRQALAQMSQVPASNRQRLIYDALPG